MKKIAFISIMSLLATQIFAGEYTINFVNDMNRKVSVNGVEIDAKTQKEITLSNEEEFKVYVYNLLQNAATLRTKCMPVGESENKFHTLTITSLIDAPAHSQVESQESGMAFRIMSLGK